MSKIEHNVMTGETVEAELTEEELVQQQIDHQTWLDDEAIKEAKPKDITADDLAQVLKDAGVLNDAQLQAVKGK